MKNKLYIVLFTVILFSRVFANPVITAVTIASHSGTIPIDIFITDHSSDSISIVDFKYSYNNIDWIAVEDSALSNIDELNPETNTIYWNTKYGDSAITGYHSNIYLKIRVLNNIHSNLLKSYPSPIPAPYSIAYSDSFVWLSNTNYDSIIQTDTLTMTNIIFDTSIISNPTGADIYDTVLYITSAATQKVYIYSNDTSLIFDTFVEFSSKNISDIDYHSDSIFISDSSTPSFIFVMNGSFQWLDTVTISDRNISGICRNDSALYTIDYESAILDVRNPACPSELIYTTTLPYDNITDIDLSDTKYFITSNNPDSICQLMLPLLSNFYTTGAFFIDNNSTPTVTYISDSSPIFSGSSMKDTLTFYIALADTDNDTLNLSIYYRRYSDTYHEASIISDTQNISSDSYANNIEVIWSLQSDLNPNAISGDTTIVVKILVSDGINTSVQTLQEDSVGYYNLPPSISIVSDSSPIFSGSSMKDTLTFYIALADTDNDTLNLSAYYRRYSDTYQEASIISDTQNISSDSYANNIEVIWSLQSDLNPNAISGDTIIIFNISVSDGINPPVTTESNVNVGYIQYPPNIFIYGDSGPLFSGKTLKSSIYLALSMSDTNNDILNCELKYLDTDNNWQLATLSGSTTGITSSTYNASNVQVEWLISNDLNKNQISGETMTSIVAIVTDINDTSYSDTYTVSNGYTNNLPISSTYKDSGPLFLDGRVMKDSVSVTISASDVDHDTLSIIFKYIDTSGIVTNATIVSGSTENITFDNYNGKLLSYSWSFSNDISLNDIVNNKGETLYILPSDGEEYGNTTVLFISSGYNNYPSVTINFIDSPVFNHTVVRDTGIFYYTVTDTENDTSYIYLEYYDFGDNAYKRGDFTSDTEILPDSLGTSLQGIWNIKNDIVKNSLSNQSLLPVRILVRDYYDSGYGDTTNIIVGYVNDSPTITISNYSDSLFQNRVLRDTVDIIVNLSDYNSDFLSIFTYYLTGNNQYYANTVGATTNITPTQYLNKIRFSWHCGTDISETYAIENFGITIALVAFDGENYSDTIYTFIESGYNHAPTVSYLSDSGPIFTGITMKDSVSIALILSDLDADSITSLSFKYIKNNILYNATLLSGETSNISMINYYDTIEYNWNISSDLTSTEVKDSSGGTLYITPYDQYNYGSTTVVHLSSGYNYPPSIVISAPISNRSYSGDITLSQTVTDNENDSFTLSFYYLKNGTYTQAFIRGDTDNLVSGSKSLVWCSHYDTPYATGFNTRIKVIASDIYSSTISYSNYFYVDNYIDSPDFIYSNIIVTEPIVKIIYNTSNNSKTNLYADKYSFSLDNNSWTNIDSSYIEYNTGDSPGNNRFICWTTNSGSNSLAGRNFSTVYYRMRVKSFDQLGIYHTYLVNNSNIKDITYNNTLLFAADELNKKVYIYDRNSDSLLGETTVSFYISRIDYYDNYFYIIDKNNRILYKCNNDATLSIASSKSISSAAPMGIEVESSDSIWIVDNSEKKIYLYNSSLSVVDSYSINYLSPTGITKSNDYFYLTAASEDLIYELSYKNDTFTLIDTYSIATTYSEGIDYSDGLFLLSDAPSNNFYLFNAFKYSKFNSSNSFGVNNNSAPTITIFPDTTGEYSGDINITYSLSDYPGDSDYVYWKYRYNGTDYSPHYTGNTSPITVFDSAISLVWNSRADLPGIDNSEIYIIMYASDYTDSSSITTGPIHIDNNYPPAGNIISPSGTLSNDISFTVILSDTENDSISLNCYYSINSGGTYYIASTNADSVYSAGTYTIVWHSGSDTYTNELQSSTVRFKIELWDIDSGSAITTNDFSIENSNDSPSVTINSMSYSGDTVTINFTPTDPENSQHIITVDWQYAFDEGSLKYINIPAKAIFNNNPTPSGQTSTIYWSANIGPDNVDGYHKKIYFRMKVTDMTGLSSTYTEYSISNGAKLTDVAFQYNYAYAIFNSTTTDTNNLCLLEYDDTLTLKTKKQISPESLDGINISDNIIYLTSNSANKIYKYSIDGESITMVGSADVSSAVGVWKLSDTIVIASNRTNQINFLDPGSFSPIIQFASPGPEPSGIAFDGLNIWTSDTSLATIYKHNADMSVATSYTISGVVPYGLDFDGTYLWTADKTNNKLYRLNWNYTSDYNVNSTYGPIYINFNNPPTITITNTISGTADTQLTIAYTITDDVNDTLTITPQYGLYDSGVYTWYQLSTTSSTTDIQSSNYSGTIVWNVSEDFPDTTISNLMVRLIPSDELNTGNPDTSGTITISNNVAPLLTITGFDTTTTYYDTLPIHIVLHDSGNDRLSVQMYYSVNSGSEYISCSLVNDSISYLNYDTTIIWNIRDNIADTTLSNIMLKLFCRDESSTSNIENYNNISIVTNYPPQYFIYYYSDTLAETTPFYYVISDSGLDTVTFFLSYSTDCTSFHSGTLSGTYSSIAHEDYSGTFYWLTTDNLGDSDYETICVRIYGIDDRDTGQIFSVDTLFINNNMEPVISNLKINDTGLYLNDTISFSFYIYDRENDSVNITFDYTVDNETFVAFNPYNDLVSYNNDTITLYWNSSDSLPNIYSHSFRIRLLPRDNQNGLYYLTDSYIIINGLDTPLLHSFSYSYLTTRSDTIQINYFFSDESNDSAIVNHVQYSIDGSSYIDIDTRFLSALSYTSPGTNTFYWYPTNNLDGLHFDTLYFRFNIVDISSLVSEYPLAQNNLLDFNLNRPPTINISFPKNVYGREINYSFALSDTAGDTIHYNVLLYSDSLGSYISPDTTVNNYNITNYNDSNTVLFSIIPDNFIDTVQLLFIPADDFDTGDTTSYSLYIETIRPQSYVLNLDDTMKIIADTPLTVSGRSLDNMGAISYVICGVQKLYDTEITTQTIYDSSQWTFNISSLNNNDSYYVYFRAVDCQGNIENNTDTYLIIYNNLYPQVNITYPLNKDILKGTVNITGTVYDNDFQNYIVKIIHDSDRYSSKQPDFTYLGTSSIDNGILYSNWITENIEDTFLILITASDLTGHSNQVRRLVFVDNIPIDTVDIDVITSHNKYARSSDTYYITGLSEPMSSINKAYIMNGADTVLNISDSLTINNNGSISGILNLSFDTVSNIRLKINVLDLATNVSPFFLSDTITIDYDYPITDNINIQSNSFFNTYPIIISGRIVDYTTDIDSVFVSTNNGINYTQIDYSYSSHYCTYSFSPPNDGTFFVLFKTADSAGNIGYSDTKTIYFVAGDKSFNITNPIYNKHVSSPVSFVGSIGAPDYIGFVVTIYYDSNLLHNSNDIDTNDAPDISNDTLFLLHSDTYPTGYYNIYITMINQSQNFQIHDRIFIDNTPPVISNVIAENNHGDTDQYYSPADTILISLYTGSETGTKCYLNFNTNSFLDTGDTIEMHHSDTLYYYSFRPDTPAHVSEAIPCIFHLYDMVGNVTTNSTYPFILNIDNDSPSVGDIQYYNSADTTDNDTIYNNKQSLRVYLSLNYADSISNIIISIFDDTGTIIDTFTLTSISDTIFQTDISLSSYITGKYHCLTVLSDNADNITRFDTPYSFYVDNTSIHPDWYHVKYSSYASYAVPGETISYIISLSDAYHNHNKRIKNIVVSSNNICTNSYLYDNGITPDTSQQDYIFTGYITLSDSVSSETINIDIQITEFSGIITVFTDSIFVSAPPRVTPLFNTPIGTLLQQDSYVLNFTYTGKIDSVYITIIDNIDTTIFYPVIKSSHTLSFSINASSNLIWYSVFVADTTGKYRFFPGNDRMSFYSIQIDTDYHQLINKSDTFEFVTSDGFSISIPPETLNHDTDTIDIRRLSYNITDTGFSSPPFNVYEINLKSNQDSFDTNIYISMPFFNNSTDSDFVAPYYLSETDSDWHFIVFTRNDTNLTLDFSINHLTIFAVIMDKEKPSLLFKSPENNLYLLPSSKIVFSAVDLGAGIDTDNISLKLNDNTFNYSLSLLPNNMFVATPKTPFNDGMYSLKLSAFDRINNEDETIVTFFVQAGLNVPIFYNYPNPFNPDNGTHFVYTISNNNATSAKIEIYNINGDLIKVLIGTSNMNENILDWDGTDFHENKVEIAAFIAKLIITDSDNNKLFKYLKISGWRF